MAGQSAIEVIRLNRGLGPERSAPSTFAAAGNR